MKSLIFVIVAAFIGLAACDSKPAESEATTGAEAEAPATGESETVAEGEGAAAGEMVAVAKSGTKFDPPVEKSQIPAGAWICDMGKVEYARMEKGDGKCPVCGMNLKQHGDAPAAEGAAGDGHDHDGHDHDGHDHDGHDHDGHDHDGHDHAH